MDLLTGLLTLLSSSCQTPYVCPVIQQTQVSYWKSAWTEGSVFFESLQPPHGRLMAASQQPMKHAAWDFYKLQSGQKAWRSIWRRCCARWLRNRAVCFCELQGTAVLQAVPEPSCFPRTPHALCNPPACYEHEVNKTLGHHKSLANDMSGTEIRQPE